MTVNYQNGETAKLVRNEDGDVKSYTARGVTIKRDAFGEKFIDKRVQPMIDCIDGAVQAHTLGRVSGLLRTVVYPADMPTK